MNERSETEVRMGFLMERIIIGELSMTHKEIMGWGFDGGAAPLIFEARKPRLYGMREMGWKNRIPADGIPRKEKP